MAKTGKNKYYNKVLRKSCWNGSLTEAESDGKNKPKGKKGLKVDGVIDKSSSDGYVNTDIFSNAASTTEFYYCVCGEHFGDSGSKYNNQQISISGKYSIVSENGKMSKWTGDGSCNSVGVCALCGHVYVNF